MRFRWGSMVNPSWLTFEHDGYWHEDSDGVVSYRRYTEPKWTRYNVRKFYGFVLGNRMIIGVTWLSKRPV